MSIYDEVKAERERAHAKHGDTSMESFAWDDLTRLTVLLEEVGEVARCFNEARHHHLTYEEVGPSLREELVQVAAMAAAWADVLDPEPPKCDGRCIHASDLGLPHNVMAYPDPECSLHGTWGQLGDPVASPEDAT